MTSNALNAYEKQSPSRTTHVWFMGTGALLEGQAVCFNWDFGTATAEDGRRGNRVEPPTAANSLYFAGVAARDYSANSAGATRPQMIEIYEPGSYCNVLSKASTTIGVARLTFEITAVVGTNGTFIHEGLEGEGSCVPLQTIDRSSTAGLCFVLLDRPGRPSGGFESVQMVDNTAFVAMSHGTTGLIGATLGAGDAIETLIAGTVVGQRKRFIVIDTEVATNDIVVTITNGRSAALADTSLETVTFAGASTVLGTSITLEWQGGWFVIGASETMPALA